MSNLTVIDNGGLLKGKNFFQDEPVVGALGVMAKGTLLMRAGTDLVPYVVGGGDAIAVLADDVDFAVAGTLVLRPCVHGKVNRNKLVIAAGDPITVVEKDALRHVGIMVLEVSDNSFADNA